MGFYREERAPKSHCFELTLVASRTRMYPNGYNMLNRPVLRAPAVHGVSSRCLRGEVRTFVILHFVECIGYYMLLMIWRAMKEVTRRLLGTYRNIQREGNPDDS